jgi:ABC-type transporter Mla MlaB component
LTKAITIIALTCFLLAGAAVTSILSHGGMQAIEVSTPAPVVKSPVANRETKQDRLSIASLALASFEPPQTASVTEPLRQAYAASSAADVEAAKAVAALPPLARVASAEPAKPKVADKPSPQKPYALLSDAQIAGIKQRLKLSSSQESYWPAVETALRAMAKKLHAARQENPAATAAQLDPDSAEVQQLKSAALPLLFQLREDQKEEVRKLARIIGLEKVASAI